MAQTIGVAGWQPVITDFESQGSTYENCGYVAAMTKSITSHDLVFDTTNHSQEPFARLFVNTCLWAARSRSSGPVVYFFSTGDINLDQRIESLLEDCNLYVTNIGPWHVSWADSDIPKGTTSNQCGSVKSPDLYLLMPSFNAFGALASNDRRMDYTLQSRVYNDVVNKQSGLVITEWFHFLHSQFNRQTFYNANSPSQSLYLLSPFEIPNATPSATTEDPFVIVDTDNAYMNRVVVEDSMSRAMPSSFEIEMSNATLVPYNAEYTNIFEAKPSATIFWTTDTVEVDVVVNTTPPPLPEPVELNAIKMKIAEVSLPESCGPMNLRLDGFYQNYFKLEGTTIYLIREPSDRIKLPITVIAEDHFRPRRFPTVSETHVANFDKCDAKITLPLNGAGPAFSYRRCNFGNMWGSNDQDDVSIAPFEEWSFTGDGTTEFPSIATLAGQHCDTNVLWLQLNAGGQLNVTVEADTELPPSHCGHNVSSGGQDYGYFYVIQNTNPDLPSIFPTQHDQSLSIFNTNENVNKQAYYHSQGWQTVTSWKGKLTSTKTITVPDPNATAGGERIRGDAYLAFIFQKGMYKSVRTDRLKILAYFGDSTTAPPEECDVNVLANNNMNNARLTGFSQTAETNQLISKTYTQIEGTNFSNTSFTMRALNGLYIDTLTLNHDNSSVINNLTYSPVGNPSLTKTISVDFVSSFPCPDQSVTIDIDGTTVTTTTTTTTTCPPCQLTLDVENDINDVRFVYNGITYRKGDADLQIVYDVCSSNTQTSRQITYYTENNKVYYSNSNPLKPSAHYISGENLTVNVSRSNNTSGTIVLTWNHLGCTTGQAYASAYKFDGNPSNTTTTTTTTQTPFCDDIIEILCEQTLHCVSDPSDESACIPSLSLSSQRLITATCCSMTEAEQVQRVFDFFGETWSFNSKLEDIPALLNECSNTVTEAFGECAAKDSDGNCNETILTKPVAINFNGSTVIYCTPPSQNPLP